MRTNGVRVRSWAEVDGMGTSVAYGRDSGTWRQEQENGDSNCRIRRKVDIKCDTKKTQSRVTVTQLHDG